MNILLLSEMDFDEEYSLIRCLCISSNVACSYLCLGGALASGASFGGTSVSKALFLHFIPCLIMNKTSLSLQSNLTRPFFHVAHLPH